MKETILYGIRQGNEEWQEELLTTDATRIEQATIWAKAHGFNRFRRNQSRGIRWLRR